MYEGPERRAIPTLSDAEIDAIAERAAEKALERVYTEIGRSVVNKVLWALGAAGLAIFAYLKGAGKA